MKANIKSKKGSNILMMNYTDLLQSDGVMDLLVDTDVTASFPLIVYLIFGIDR